MSTLTSTSSLLLSTMAVSVVPATSSMTFVVVVLDGLGVLSLYFVSHFADEVVDHLGEQGDQI